MTEENFREDALSSSSDKAKRDATHVLENTLDYDQEDEEDSTFMQVFQEFTFIGGVDI